MAVPLAVLPAVRSPPTQPPIDTLPNCIECKLCIHIGLLTAKLVSFVCHCTIFHQVLRQAFVERTGLNPDSKKPGEKYTIGPQPLPLAAQRNRGNPECVTWTGTDVLLGDRLIDMANAGPSEASRWG